MDPNEIRTILNYDTLCRRANVEPELTNDERILLHRRLAKPSVTLFQWWFINKLKKISRKIKKNGFQPVVLQISASHKEYAITGNEKVFINAETALKLLHNGRAN